MTATHLPRPLPCIEQVAPLLESIDHAGLRRAARRWFHRHRPTAHPLALARLAADWEYLARRHGRNANPHVYYALFDRLAALPPALLPGVDAVRYLLRSLLRFPHLRPWEAMEDRLRRAVSPVGADDWRAHHRQCCDGENARGAARVGFDDMADELTRFNDFLFAAGAPLPLKQAKLDGFTAWTDAKVITLPDAIDLTPHRLLNEWAYLRLLAHEVEHLEAGTFAFRFDSPEGGSVWRRLAPRRETFQRNREGWDGRQVLERLLRSGDDLGGDFKPFLPHLVAFTFHFEDAKAAHGLFNLVEDVRVERSLATKYPALADVAGVLDDYETDLLPHPRFCTPAANFLRALHARAFGREVPAHVTRDYRAAMDRAGAVFDGFRAAPLGDATSSVAATLDVIEALEATLPPGGSEEVGRELSLRVQVPLEDVAFRIAATVPNLDEFDPDKPHQKMPYQDLPEPPPDGPGPFAKYPEFDVWERRRRADAVYVQDKPWVPWREPHALTGESVAVGMALPRIVRAGADAFRRRPDGFDLDLDRAYDAAVALQTGRSADDRLFRVRRPEDTAAWNVSLVVDLSVSMEAPRGGNESDTPLRRAVRAAALVADWLERSGLPVAVFGVHDHGRRPVDVYTVKDNRDPFRRERLASMHAVGVGGFRHGAVVRHLAARLGRERPGGRHLIVLMTDAASHYLAPGYDRAGRQIAKSRCANCQARGRCPVEAKDARLTMRNTTAPPNIYFPTFYEMADLKDALAANPHVDPLFAVLDTGYAPGVLDKAVGPGRWVQVSNDQQVPLLIRVIRRVIVGVS